MRHSTTVPDRLTRVKIAAAAECDERAVRRFFQEPDRVRPAIRAAIVRALPSVGIHVATVRP